MYFKQELFQSQQIVRTVTIKNKGSQNADC